MQRYDALATGSDTGGASSARVLTLLMSAHRNLITLRPEGRLCVDARSEGTC